MILIWVVRRCCHYQHRHVRFGGHCVFLLFVPRCWSQEGWYWASVVAEVASIAGYTDLCEPLYIRDVPVKK